MSLPNLVSPPSSFSGSGSRDSVAAVVKQATSFVFMIFADIILKL